MWFADEARVGQKNKITRRWIRFGGQARQPPPFPQGRPPRRTSAPPPPASLARSVPRTERPQGVRRENCPPDSFLIRFTLPQCNTQAMNLHLAEISGMVAPGRHTLLLLDQAGWHLSHHLVVPENVTLLPQPPQVP